MESNIDCLLSPGGMLCLGKVIVPVVLLQHVILDRIPEEVILRKGRETAICVKRKSGQVNLKKTLAAVKDAADKLNDEDP